MKSILFENGKLYVVELPDEKNPFLEQGIDYYGALADKVEVKNGIALMFTAYDSVWYLASSEQIKPMSVKLKDGGTFDLPVDLTFDKETGMLKRIEDIDGQKVYSAARPEGLHNGMTAQQVYEWLDKRCMFEPHQKDYVLLIIKLIINAKIIKE